MILALGLALAAPDRVAWSESLGAGLDDLASTADGAWLATVDGGGVVWLLDTGSWSTTAVSGTCADPSGVVALPGDTAAFAVGCGDGTADRVDLDDQGELTLTAAAWLLGDGPVLRLATDGASLFGVVDGTDGTQLAAVDLDSGAAGDSFPVTLYYSGVRDLELAGTALVVVHGEDDLSRLATTGGAPINPGKAQFGRDFVDAWPYSTAEVWLADAANGDALRLSLLDNTFSLYQVDLAPACSALAIDEDAGWFAAGGDGGVWFYEVSAGVPIGEGEGVAHDAAPVEMVPVGGDLLLVDDGGGIAVLTEAPWVEAAVDPAEGTTTTRFVLDFESDTDGDYEVRVGGTVDGGGSLAGSGALLADQRVELSLDAADFEEGRNRVWVFVDDGVHLGHDAVDVVIDTPPAAPDLDAADLQAGDSFLQLSFDALDAEDVSTYMVYLSSAPFTAAEYPTGGPPWDGDAAVDAPRTLTGITPGERVVVEFAPLQNGTMYTLAVRALDDGGLESPMSDLLTAAPVASYSASELAGDPGGYCASSPAAGAWLGLLGLLAAASRRGLPRALAGFLVLAVPLTARAAEDPQDREDRPRFHAALRGGPTWLADPHIQEVFGESAPHFRGEYGVTTRLLELGAGVGYLKKKGYLLTEDGGVTDEWDKLTLIPATLDLTVRLDFFPEQLLVPFGRIGADYLFWWERWYVYEGSTAEDRRKGGKPGWHWAAGGLLLLDPLDPRAASRMRAVSGIDDTFLVFEYRQTTMPEGAQVLELSNREVSAGFKFDF